MPITIYATSLGLIAIMTGCKSTDTNGPANTSDPSTATTPGTMASPASTTTTSTVKGKVDSCKLLTNDDLKEVQGEAPKEAQRSDREQGGFVVAQCYYSLPTTSNSVVLNITTASEGGGVRDRKNFGKILSVASWKRTATVIAKEDPRRVRKKNSRSRPKKSPVLAMTLIGSRAVWAEHSTC